MKLTKQEWKKLNFPIAALGLAGIFSGIFAVAANYMYTQAAAKHQTITNELNAAKQKFMSSGQEKQLIETYLPEYQRLIESGFVGEERRIEWVEHLRQIHNQYKLFGIDYTIGAQEKYTPSFLPEMGNFVLQRSVMKLDLAMLHEGDLLNLLNDLKMRESTPAMVRDCEVIRTGDTRPNNKDLVPRMQAKCEIDWLTVREPFGSEAGQ